MNGHTDQPSEIFTQQTFREILAYAQSKHVGRFQFWSLNRDRQCSRSSPTSSTDRTDDDLQRARYVPPMEIIRNDDGTLVVPVEPERRHDSDDDADAPTVDADDEAAPAKVEPETRVLHPGEGGYDEALAEWDLQQNPDRAPVVSTASGRDQAMAVVHAVAMSPDRELAASLEAVDDPEATGEALRHVLVGGVPSVDAFAAEVAEAEGGDPLPAHEVTRIIGQVLAELDK